MNRCSNEIRKTYVISGVQIITFNDVDIIYRVLIDTLTVHIYRIYIEFSSHSVSAVCTVSGRVSPST